MSWCGKHHKILPEMRQDREARQIAAVLQQAERDEESSDHRQHNCESQGRGLPIGMGSDHAYF